MSRLYHGSLKRNKFHLLKLTCYITQRIEQVFKFSFKSHVLVHYPFYSYSSFAEAGKKNVTRKLMSASVGPHL